MATDTAERRAAHVRGVTVTAICCLAGLAAGVISASVAEGPGDWLGVWVFLGALLVQYPIYSLLHRAGLERLDTEEFSGKDHLYVVFMTFVLWFITWTIMLTTGAAI